MARAQLAAAVAMNFAHFVEVSLFFALLNCAPSNLHLRKHAQNLPGHLNGISAQPASDLTSSFSCRWITSSRTFGRPTSQLTSVDYRCYRHPLDKIPHIVPSDNTLHTILVD